MKIAVLASGAGTTLEHLIRASKLEHANYSIEVVISNSFYSGALDIAVKSNIRQYTATEDKHIVKLLKGQGVELIVLAGYLKKVGEGILKEYAGRIINVHPSLLPKYGGKGMYGRKVHKEVLSSTDSITGATVHYVDESYDTGAIIAQTVIQIADDETVDSIEAKVKAIEKTLLCTVLNSLANGEYNDPK